MPLPSPNLDDREFDDLIKQAEEIVKIKGQGWDVTSVSDPGRILLELFAHLTETMIYRINQVPHKVYIELLKIIGVELIPPAAARTILTFTRKDDLDQIIVIPKDTVVTSDQTDKNGEAISFTTVETVKLEPQQESVEILSLHCQQINAELIGKGNGEPGLSLSIEKSPIIAATGRNDDLLIGIEVYPDDTYPATAKMVEVAAQKFHIWREVTSFTNEGDDPFIYVADRINGRISFAPAIQEVHSGRLNPLNTVLGSTPIAGRLIRAWYRTGGGGDGNLASNSIKNIEINPHELEVTNQHPSQGGQDEETLENAFLRGPQELNTLQRAVTARDFELVVIRSDSRVNRAKAFAKCTEWPGMEAGTAVVNVVPNIDDDVLVQTIHPQFLETHQNPQILIDIQNLLTEIKPLGTHTQVNWCRYKNIFVKAKIIIDEDYRIEDVRERLNKALDSNLCPIRIQESEGWPFGKPLHSSKVYSMLMEQNGVRFIDGQVSLIVEEAPDHDVTVIESDPYKSLTWYASSGPDLFRSVNQCESWEKIFIQPSGKIIHVKAHPQKPGHLAVVVRNLKDQHYQDKVYVSLDYGETWPSIPMAVMDFEIEDICWCLSSHEIELFCASDEGLFKITQKNSPFKVLVNSENPDQSFRTVSYHIDTAGVHHVIVAAQNGSGVFMSTNAGTPNTFQPLGLTKKHIRCMAVQQYGSRFFIWIGFSAIAGDEGEGLYRFNLSNPEEGWVAHNKEWSGGSCTSISFYHGMVLAGTHHGGVQILLRNLSNPKWKGSSFNSQLPIREKTQSFYPTLSVAGSARDGIDGILVGTTKGVHQVIGDVKDLTFQCKSNKVSYEKQTLPKSWLFCPSDHDLEIVYES